MSGDDCGGTTWLAGYGLRRFNVYSQMRRCGVDALVEETIPVYRYGSADPRGVRDFYSFAAVDSSVLQEHAEARAVLARIDPPWV